MGFSFFVPAIPNIPTSGGEFADRITEIMANRRKIDQERELKRQQDEARANLEAIQSEALDASRNARISSALEDLPEGDREANRAFAEANPEATAFKGKLYSTYDAAKEAHRQSVQQDFMRAQAKQRGEDFDALQAEYDARLAESKRLRQGALGQLKDDGTPEAEKAIADFYDGQMAKIEAEFNAKKRNYLDKNGKLIGTAAEKKARDAELVALGKALEDAAAKRELAQGDKAAYFRKHAESRAGLSKDVQAQLEAELLLNPFRPRKDYRAGQDRALDAALERRMPEIIRLQSLIPDQVKASMEWIKRNQSQADAASKAEMTTYDSQRKESMALLGKYREGAANAARNAEMLAQRARELAAKKDWKAAENALGWANLNFNAWKVNYSKLMDLENAHVRGGYGVLASAAQTQNLYTPEGRAEIERQLNRVQGDLASTENLIYGARKLRAPQLFVGGEVAPPQERKESTTIKGDKGILGFGSTPDEVKSIPIVVPGSYYQSQLDGATVETGVGKPNKPGKPKGDKPKPPAAPPARKVTIHWNKKK